MRRERNERLALVSMFVKILGDAVGLSAPALDGMLDIYMLELFQDGYRPSVVAALRSTRSKRKRKTLRDQALLEKVEKFTVSDEELSRAQKSAKRGPRRR